MVNPEKFDELAEMAGRIRTALSDAFEMLGDLSSQLLLLKQQAEAQAQPQPQPQPQPAQPEQPVSPTEKALGEPIAKSPPEPEQPAPSEAPAPSPQPQPATTGHTELIQCPNCGTMLAKGTAPCPVCGHPLSGG